MGMSPQWILFSIMALMFVLGFFLDFLEICFIVIPIVLPVINSLGFDPLWVAILIAINLQTSFLTPPFGFALFYLKGVAPPEVKTSDIYRGIIPFVGIQIVVLFLLANFSQLTLWLPSVVFPQ
jgi:TRAP-type mannitol/chloroaromatic compound transport system permease large subunit